MGQKELHEFEQGDFLEAADLNVHVALLRRGFSGPNTAFDVNGVYQRRKVAAATEWEFGKLNADLNGGAGNFVSVAVYIENAAGDAWVDANHELDKVYATPLLPDGETLTEGTWVEVRQHRNGRWYASVAGCNGEP